MNPSSEDTLFFHAPCFDGIISAVLAWDILETSQGWNIKHFVPVTYTADDSWLQLPLPKRSAVVDFSYHPRATFC